MKKYLLFIVYCLLFTKLNSQTSFFSGVILFYYNSHESELNGDSRFYSLDSVRLHTINEIIPVWAKFSQQEYFLQDTSILSYANGKNFKLWDNLPQFSQRSSKMYNYEHVGGDCYYDKNNEIVIAFFITGEGFFFKPNNKNIELIDQNTLTLNNDTISVPETVWHNYKTYNKGSYIIFTRIVSTASLKRKQRQKEKLYKSRNKVDRFYLYGN